MNETKKMLQKMLKEEVPRSFLDSGGIPQYDEDGNYVGSKDGYGRNFERNQGLPPEAFENSPSSVIEVEEYNGHANPWVMHSTYHWLLEVAEVEYAPAADKAFRQWTEGNRTPWIDDMEEYTSSHLQADRPYGSEPMTVNTSNGESALDQVIQYVLFCGDLPTEDGEVMEDVMQVLLQIHGGADVRGGYTSPRLFTLYGESILDDARAGISCDTCEAAWSSDDNWHFYVSHRPKLSEIHDLGKYGLTKIEEKDYRRARCKIKSKKEKRKHQSFFCDPGPIPEKRIMKEVAGIEEGNVVALEDAGDRYGDYLVCPVCLKGRLMPCF